MLFWISVMIAVVAVIFIIVCHCMDWDGGFVFFTGTFAVATVVMVIMGLVIVIAHVGNDGYIAQMNTRYESLVYQYENEFYENDNDVGKRELIADIQSWNEDLAKNKINQDDFWVGIFHPNIYDQFEFIELK